MILDLEIESSGIILFPLKHANHWPFPTSNYIIKRMKNRMTFGDSENIQLSDREAEDQVQTAIDHLRPAGESIKRKMN